VTVGGGRARIERRFSLVFACLLWLAFSATTRNAHAQQGAGVFIGTVIDASTREPLADVVVTVTSPALQGEQTVLTDGAGVYRVPDLPPGVYAVHLDRELFKPYAREGITLRADTTLRVNAELLPETVQAYEVTVIGRPPTVDVGSSSTGGSLSSDFAARVPLSRPGSKGSTSRSFESIADALPGANADTYGVSISGTTSPENNYVIDGTSVNSPGFGIIGTPLSMEFIKEVSVISGGYMPEYGRATGGIFNVVTKSGSNEFHGGAFFYFAPGALEGKRTPVQQNGQTILMSPSLSYVGDMGADVGGPIIKDKLWFYAGFDIGRTRYNIGRSLYRTRLDAAGNPVLDGTTGFTVTDPILGTYSSLPAEMQQIQAIGKLTYALNQDNQLTLAVIATPSTSGGNGKYAVDPQTGLPEVMLPTLKPIGLAGQYGALATRRNSTVVDTSMKWSSAFHNKRVLLDTTVGWHHEGQSILPSDGSDPGSSNGLAGTSNLQWRAPHAITDFETLPNPAACAPVTVTNPDGSTQTVTPCPVQQYDTGGPEKILYRQNMDRYQARSVLTLLGQALGHHVVKTGVDLEYVRYADTKAYAGGALYQEAPDGSGFFDFRHFGYLRGPDDPVHLATLEVTTKAVTVGGFAQDSWSVLDQVTLNLGVRYDAQFLYDSTGSRALSLPNEWSPRLGAIYDPTHAGRAKIFTNYARFYESVPLDLADRALSGEPQYGSAYPIGCAVAGVPAVGPCLGPSNRQVVSAPGDPNQTYFAFGGPEAIDPNIKPQSTDEFVLGGEYEVTKNGRLGASYTKRWLNYAIEDMSRDEGRTAILGNPGYGSASDFPKAERNYDAVTFYFSKIFTDEWLAQASYTISYLRGNYSGLFHPETDQLDPNINSDFDLKSLLPNRTGPLPGDRTHQVKLFGAKEWALLPEHHLTTGTGLRAHSGEPTNYLGAHPIYGPDEAYILPRGSGERTPWEFSADLQIGYRYKVDKDKSVQATIDVFNLLNFQAATSTDQRYTQSFVLPVANGKANADGTIPGLKNADGSPFDPTTKNPNFGNPNRYQPPRMFRFGLRATF